MLEKVLKVIKSKRGSPLVEEGILIGLALFCFLLLLGAVLGILDWFTSNSEGVLQELSGLFP